MVLFHLVLQSYAGTENFPTGARSAGMANASVVLKDIWSVQHNQAGLAYIKTPELGLYYENRFQIKELSLTSLVFAYPVINGVFGLNLTHWGYSKFNTTKVGLSFAKSFSKTFSAGIQLDYFNTYFTEEYGNRGSVVVEAGIRAEPVENLIIGAHIYNPTRAKLAIYDDERLPTILRLGIGYRFSDNVLMTIETQKGLVEKIVFKTGIEYFFANKLYLRAGIASEPVSNTFGIGYVLKNLNIDLAFSRHQVFGLGPHFSVNYSF
ncbi:MAG: hypothetical protein GXO79_05080 [Chlorobi bacterium]|nr:hypothetical protein [Chlorobiota bacterium]